MIPPKADPKICFRGKFNGQMNHTRIVDSKNCTSLFMKRQPRSRMERRTLPGVGRWYRPALFEVWIFYFANMSAVWYFPEKNCTVDLKFERKCAILLMCCLAEPACPAGLCITKFSHLGVYP